MVGERMTNVAVYLESTLELLGIVRCDPERFDELKSRRLLFMAKWEPMPAIGPSDYMPLTALAAERIEFRAVTLAIGAVSAIALIVKKREHLAVWDGHQVWPRKRRRDYKPTKAERRYRRELKNTTFTARDISPAVTGKRATMHRLAYPQRP